MKLASHVFIDADFFMLHASHCGTPPQQAQRGTETRHRIGYRSKAHRAVVSTGRVLEGQLPGISSIESPHESTKGCDQQCHYLEHFSSSLRIWLLKQTCTPVLCSICVRVVATRAMKVHALLTFPSKVYNRSSLPLNGKQQRDTGQTLQC
jgi:hypothetical protein